MVFGSTVGIVHLSKASLTSWYATISAASAKEDVLLKTEDPYTPNSITEEIVLWIETADEQWMTDPWEIKRRYLTTQQSPPHFDQYRYSYEQILTETGACEFSHKFHDMNKSTSPISFSKIVILSIMPISTWGIHPHTTRDIESLSSLVFQGER